MIRLGRSAWTLLFSGMAVAVLTGAAPPTSGAGDDFEMILASLHPDYAAYVGSIRTGPGHLHPANLYMGLVREGGRDPSCRTDAPVAGWGIRNDIVVYADSREADRSLGWAMLLIDHEYFHARHLARGDRTPVPSFAEREATRHYFEAVAWGYNLTQADDGDYPTLTHADYAEAFRNYSLHFEAFRDYILRHDRPAWAYYQRFLPDPATFDRILLAQN